MHKIILFIKTYLPDFEKTKILLASIEKYNQDNIPVYVSVNDSDYPFFIKNIDDFNIELIKDSDIIYCDLKDGWRYQQVIKSSVYKLGICENYLCIDADSEFIRPFYTDDFIYEGNTPYTIMHESKPFLEMIERIGMKRIFFKEALDAVRADLKTSGKYWDYGPSPYLWNSYVWEHFNQDYLGRIGKSFQEYLLSIHNESPSECVIYGEYLRKTKLIDIIPIENFFKVFHFKKQYDFEKDWLDREQLSKIYMGIILQSNMKLKNRSSYFLKYFKKYAIK
jgi:hypothetical protein